MTDNGIEIRLKLLQEDLNHEAEMRRKLEARITDLESRVDKISIVVARLISERIISKL